MPTVYCLNKYKAIRKDRNNKLGWLHCVTSQPTDYLRLVSVEIFCGGHTLYNQSTIAGWSDDSVEAIK